MPFPNPPPGVENVGFGAAEFTYAQPNGTAVRAPLEFWVAAILQTLTPTQRENVLTLVERIRLNQIVVKGTDDFPLIISRADGG